MIKIFLLIVLFANVESLPMDRTMIEQRISTLSNPNVPFNEFLTVISDLLNDFLIRRQTLMNFGDESVASETTNTTEEFKPPVEAKSEQVAVVDQQRPGRLDEKAVLLGTAGIVDGLVSVIRTMDGRI
ncbi:hypothetical protein ACOME3_002578 [Neoechinorhynchus agilis]